MKAWHALVPIKAAADRKTRLADRLSPGERIALSERMLRHVLAILQATEAIGSITLLASDPVAGWYGARLSDDGRGLNAEVQAAAARIGDPLLVIHADLPALAVADIRALTHAGRNGVALAADRHRRGTNAIALGRRDDFVFAFGPDSLARHRTQCSATAIIERPGLALDIDVFEDLTLFAGDRAARQAQIAF
ncbi:2-phospho-L-lactate guanylyltransferase [Sphingomonas sp. BIUV-7]|uniref:3-phospho-D-glycerate guanylyltransferase n=1 Tax=Sphingomonas natans TaxID=3063330 RepID=A0ABT8Y825_9SPHN|nr:2-phospho-L-lactate guanylyltransferase [Sphingomonas sp. BIUV-7]MDO6414476.1 2-phospho-L-lactate guanylyltransferase [Sphingomonas sp. BIUV-7]